MFWRSLTKIGQIYKHYKIGQSGCNPPKIKYEILAHKGSQTTRAIRLSRLLKLRTNGTTAMIMNQDFPGKVTHCRHDQWSDEEDDNIMYGKFWFDGDFFVQNLDAFRLNV